MSENERFSRKFVAQRAAVNADSRDMLNVPSPQDLTPVWPETDSKNISFLIDQNRERIDKHLNGHEGKFLHAQYRALDYLYGKKEEALNDKEANPLVDVIALIANVGDKRNAASSLQLAIEGDPQPSGWIIKTSKSKKPEQRTFEDTPLGTREYRTIARFSGQLSTVLRGLYILGEAAKHHPVIIRSTVHEYSHTYSGGKNEVAGTAIGILEIISNLGLLYDGRFNRLSEQLRDVILEEVDGYEELKNKYSYRIIDNSPFWYNGQLSALSRKKMNYRKAEDKAERVETGKYPELDLPVISNWQINSKRRSEITTNLRDLTLFNSVKKVAVDFTEDKAIESVKNDRLKKADLTEQKRTLESKEIQELRRSWRSFIEAEIDEGSHVTDDETELISKAVEKILNYFAKDDKLSQKAKTNIKGRINEIDSTEYYEIEATELAKDELFVWILSLRNPYVAEGLKAAIEKNGQSLESFYLLLKVMTFDVLKKSLKTKEYDFIFDPNYRQKMEPDSLLGLFEEIRELTDQFTPDVSEIVKNAIVEGDSKIEDLISEEALGKFRQKLEKLTYKTVLGIFRKDKSKALTKEDKKRARWIARQLLITAGSVLLYSLLLKGTDSFRDYLEEKKEMYAKEEEAERRAWEQLKLERSVRMERQLQKIQSLDFAAIDQVGREALRLENLRERPEPYRSASQEAGMAAELQRIPGEINDRIPDAINSGEGEGMRLESERPGLIGFGRIYHFPESMAGTDGEPVGYFPWDINLANMWNVDINTTDRFSWRDIQPFENTIWVDSIDRNLMIDYKPNQLAYSLNGVNPETYPPIGWKIVSVYQEAGKQPLIGPLGELYYQFENEGDLPNRALLVLEPVEMQNVDPRINILEGVRAVSYWPSTSRYYSDMLVKELGGDPALQLIYTNFASEMEETIDGYYRGKIETGRELSGLLSEIGIKYAREYARYTSENRFYALGFQIDENGPGSFAQFPTLQSLADKPEEGYFCSVAAFGFRDFMASQGFFVGNQPGIALYNHQGYMWGGIGHMNNVVYLPDGRILEVDMTPYVSDETPDKDLDWLRGRTVTEDDIKKAIEETVNSGDQLMESVAGAGDEEALRQIATDNEIERLIQNNENYISDMELNNILKDMQESVNEMTVDRMRKNNSTSPLDNLEMSMSEEAEFSLLNKIANDLERATGNSPTITDIYTGRSSGQSILEKYETLERIEDNASLLQTIIENNYPSGERSEEVQRLQKIIDAAREMQDRLEAVAPDELREAREERAFMSAIERDYMSYYELTGKLPGQELEEINSLSRVELKRANEYKEQNREISPDEMGQFSGRLLNIAENDAKDYLAYLKQLQELGIDLRSDDIEAFDFSVGRDYYNGQIMRDAQKYSNLIENTPYLSDQLDESGKEDLKNLPEIIRRLASIIRNDTEMNIDEQIASLEQISQDLERINVELDEVDRNWEIKRTSEENEQERFKNTTERFLAQREEMGEQNTPKIKQETEKDVNTIVEYAKKLGVGLVPLGIAFFALKQRNDKKTREEIAKRIQDSLNSGRHLSKTEKDIVLSVVGHMRYLGYGEDFPEKAAAIFNLVQLFDKNKHENAIEWLANEGADALFDKDPNESFKKLLELSNGHATNTSAEEIRRYFPEHVVGEIRRLTKNGSGNGNGNGEIKLDEGYEIPFDYKVIYGLSQLIFNDSILRLRKTVMKNLGFNDDMSRISVPYKAIDVDNMLRQKYLSNHTPEQAKALFNSILLILNWSGVSEDPPIFAR